MVVIYLLLTKIKIFFFFGTKLLLLKRFTRFESYVTLIGMGGRRDWDVRPFEGKTAFVYKYSLTLFPIEPNYITFSLTHRVAVLFSLF